MTSIPPTHEDLLHSSALANVATIRPDGSPQNNPVWFDWDGTHLRFSLTTGRQKYRNLQHDPKVAVALVDPQNPYRYLEVRGVAEEIVVDEGNAFIDSMAQKYIDQPVYPWHQAGDQRVVVKVRPERISTMG